MEIITKKKTLSYVYNICRRLNFSSIKFGNIGTIITVKEGVYMKTTGVVRRVDDLGRIVIPKDIRKALRIRDGESLEFFVDKETISLKKFSTSGDLNEASQSLLDTICTTINKNIFVTDRDKVVAGSGKLKKEFYGFNISVKLEDYLSHTESLIKGSTLIEELVDTNNKGTEYNYIISPILLEGETVGFVMMIVENTISFDLEDEHLVQIIASFLSKYLED